MVQVGPGARDRDGQVIKIELAEGDRVLLPEYGGHKVQVGDDEMFLFRADDILGKFSE